MRSRPLITVAVVLAWLSACGGGEKPSGGSTTSAAPSAAAPGAAAPSTTAGAAQPITGKTWDVKMLGDAQGYRFDPKSLTIKPGDGVRWTVVSGVPHDVTFWADSIPANAAAVLGANMPKTIAPLTGELLQTLNQTYTISFAGVPAGTYHYFCTPHLAYGMKATITVQ